MNLTVLFDLDDTLLFSNMDAFLPAYLQALAKHLNHRFSGDLLIQRLLYATQKMVENDQPDCTLERVFDSHFYPALGIRREEIQGEIDAFYAEIFPTLKPLTAPRPEAIQLVEEAVKRGYRLAVATNPIFPKTAILQRLEWAGLAVADYPFELVSSYEGFHFAKPNPAYYAEVLAQLGWPDGPAVMVGNDLQNDILPARQAGLFTYLVATSQPAAGSGPDPSQAQGIFEGILSWLDRIADQQAVPTPAGAVLPMLRSTPAALSTLTTHLTPEQWAAQPQPGEWSTSEIVCHLRDFAAEIDLPRIRKVLEQENPFIPAVTSDRWAEERHYRLQNGPAALHGFTIARIQMLKLLSTMSPGDWDRPARHAIFGPTRLGELIGFMSTHDRTHLRQVYQTLAAVAQPFPARIDNPVQK